MDAAFNGAWARSHGYAHLLYCVSPPCYHPDSRETRSPQWCKVVVLADALAQGYDTVLYMDSDAYWKVPSLTITAGLIHPWAPNWGAPLRHARASGSAVGAYFGCASPWDICGVAWNFSAVNADRGSASTGVILLRNQRSSRKMLRDWWHARNGWGMLQVDSNRGNLSDSNAWSESHLTGI
eukprot:7064078-Prymnesium_polylepis.1